MTDLTGARNQCPGRRVVVVSVTSVRDGLEHLGGRRGDDARERGPLRGVV